MRLNTLNISLHGPTTDRLYQEKRLLQNRAGTRSDEVMKQRSDAMKR